MLPEEEWARDCGGVYSITETQISVPRIALRVLVERYIRAVQRAEEMREYLESRGTGKQGESHWDRFVRLNQEYKRG